MDTRVTDTKDMIKGMAPVRDPETGKIISGPDIHARGVAEDDSVFKSITPKISSALEEALKEGGKAPSNHQLQQVVRRTMGQWIARKLRRKPMIIPVVVEAGKDK